MLGVSQSQTLSVCDSSVSPHANLRAHANLSLTRMTNFCVPWAFRGHSFTHLLNMYYEPGAVPDDGGKVANERDKVPVLLELILLGKVNNT